jgi:hypothetical protein
MLSFPSRGFAMPVSLQNPYARNSNTQYRWLKGNLHAHTDLSDGSREPQTVIDLYAGLGYDFMALSDHDVFSDYSAIDAKGMILLPGNEVTQFGPHVLQIGSTSLADPHEDRQRVIDQIVATGGLAVLNHPNWESDWDHYPFELMQQLKGYAGVEVFNGVCLDLEGSHLGQDKWERLLSSGRIVWAFAHDDSHHAGQEGRGWNVVQVAADQANAGGILAALKTGNFYASTGVVIDTIETAGTELRISAKNTQEIEIYGDKGVRLAAAKGSEIRFDAANVNATYIRAQFYGQGSAMAWTQPFVVKGGAAEGRRLMEEKFGAPDSPRPKLEALRVEKIPALGSAAIESLWRKAAASDVFYDTRSGEEASVKTAVRSLVSGEQLALRIDCDEPLMDKIDPKTTTDGNGALWAEESLEIFVDVEGKRKHYYHMMVNPAGAFYVSDALAWSKSLTHQAKAHRAAKSWSVEVLFDLANLAPGLAIGPGARFGFHVCRNRYTTTSPKVKHGGQHFMWSWVGSSNHTPGRYGWLQL